MTATYLKAYGQPPHDSTTSDQVVNNNEDNYSNGYTNWSSNWNMDEKISVCNLRTHEDEQEMSPTENLLSFYFTSETIIVTWPIF